MRSYPLLCLCWIGWLFLGVLHCGVAAEATLPTKPTQYVTDGAGILSPVKRTALEAQLDAYERETSNQFLIYIQRRLPVGDVLEDYTARVAQRWGTGLRSQDNGLILFIFTEDRRTRIEVGYGLEGVLPDSIAAIVLRDDLAPAFRAGDYEAGIQRTVDSLIRVTKGEYRGDGLTYRGRLDKVESEPRIWPWVFGLGLCLLFVIWSHSGDTVYQRGGRTVIRTGLDLLTAISMSSGGSGGYGGGGRNSGGGGYSGGGGRFGGGGASGSW